MPGGSTFMGGNREARFRRLYDFLMPHLEAKRLLGEGRWKCTIGSFLIRYTICGWPHEGWQNVQIWPPGGYDSGRYVQGNKVANVSWDCGGNVELVTFRGGSWDEQLLSLLVTGEPITIVHGDIDFQGRQGGSIQSVH